MTTRPSILLLLSGVAAATLMPTPAIAQSGDDVVIMRRVIAPPKMARDTNGYDQTQYHWETGPWVLNAPTCSSAVVQERLVGCVKEYRQQPDASCPQPRPDSSRTVADYSKCGYSWQITGHGDWSSTCSVSATRDTNSQCVNSNGEPTADAKCAGKPRPGPESGEVSSGCSYAWVVGAWGDYDDRCSAATSRDRPVLCVRSDGTSGGAHCDAASRPVATEKGSDFSGCTFAWTIGQWSGPDSACSRKAGETRDVHCERQDGTATDDARCGAQKPTASRTVESLGGCKYDWAIGDWGDFSSTCSAAAARDRTVQCERSDHSVAESTLCPGDRPTTRETADVATGCSYTWKYSDWVTTPACGPTTKARTATCLRSDGGDGGTHCDVAARDTLTDKAYDTTTCGYSWKPGEYGDYSSTCSNAASRTRTEACVRSDLQPVDASLCASAAHNQLTDTAGVYSGCQHQWSYGPWISASTCSNATTQTRTATCMRAIGGEQVPVSDSWCSAATKVTTQSAADTSSCTAAWTYSAWTPTPPAATCSSSYPQTRTATCMAQVPNGTSVQVVDARCTGAKDILSQNANVTTGCSWSWNLASSDTTTGWTPWSNTCGSATRTRTVFCQRSDAPGKAVPDNQCTSARPADSQTSTQTTDCKGKLVNGGFETVGSGWVLARSAAYNTVNDPYNELLAIHSGARSISMRAWSSGLPSVTQTFPTTAGAKYSVSFWGWTYGVQRINAYVDSKFVAQNGYGGDNGAWTQGSVIFTAASANTTIKFIPSQSDDSYLNLDDVVVSQIP